ncbi:MAG: hypothetical protein KKD17_02750 [Nanoarchaeota archaeon]|nr:hypothetical protein [Nanoarchaeota archaeon]
MAHTTTIRVHKSTKRDLENLEFVKKQSFNEIIQELISTYNKSKVGK